MGTPILKKRLVRLMLDAAEYATLAKVAKGHDQTPEAYITDLIAPILDDGNVGKSWTLVCLDPEDLATVRAMADGEFGALVDEAVATAIRTLRKGGK